MANRIKEQSARAGRPMTDQQAMNAAWRARDRMVFEMSAPLSPSAASSAAGGGTVVRYGVSEGFEGYYDISNWTIFDGGDSSVDAGGAPVSIVLNGSNDEDGQGLEGRLDLTLVAGGTGLVSFYWEYSTDDEDPGYDRLIFLLNGEETPLSDNDGPDNQSGTFTVQVKVGDTLGFRINPTDNCCGGATATISAFSAPITL